MMNMDDPFANEPQRHPVLIVRTKKPFNAETPSSLLVENFITPTYDKALYRTIQSHFLSNIVIFFQRNFLRSSSFSSSRCSKW